MRAAAAAAWAVANRRTPVPWLGLGLGLGLEANPHPHPHPHPHPNPHPHRHPHPDPDPDPNPHPHPHPHPNPNPDPDPNPNLGVVDRRLRGREVGCGLTKVRLEPLPRGRRTQVPVGRKRRRARPLRQRPGLRCRSGGRHVTQAMLPGRLGKACYLRGGVLAAAEGRQGGVEHGCKPGDPDVPTSGGSVRKGAWRPPPQQQ